MDVVVSRHDVGGGDPDGQDDGPSVAGTTPRNVRRGPETAAGRRQDAPATRWRLHGELAPDVGGSPSTRPDTSTADVDVVEHAVDGDRTAA